ncbi:MAG: D-alanyl-D-alanine carboxypeptidase/D-alanyl-D-alanine-endopeptidase [Gammaproteobacteria bacterium]|nr:D-alanyl-D-alanine carboxypeptidase/D-alanyl-D-alanine-endopeptidase [Gammaproteobacteria bacterium]MDH4253686.1 D-alanyl-D-alanine carboxypeptidase/D-alanyl-D-alanine-endopeptidase [Gammaproteobacteria bacterium]MDH5310671.1 D-alanyl-D-alanine carboxypeptidase/D-alanyl-D-alanine-endopeptidase [Gammaproteobacteria bacterium]
MLYRVFLLLIPVLVLSGAVVAEDSPSVIVLDENDLPVNVRSVLKMRNLPATSLSLYVENLDTGDVLLSWKEAEPRNPASVMKLVTTLVALDRLGPAYTWKTEIFALGEISGDTLSGDLLIKGYGDPFLVTERVWQMLRNLRLTGLRKITGNLLLDDSHFQVVDHDPAAFDRQPLRAYNVAPNALMTNFKVTRFYFQPDANNDKVVIRMDPQLDNLDIENHLTTRDGSCRGYQRGIAIIPNESYDRFTFSGRFPRGCEIYAMDRTAMSHNEFTYGLFKSIWRELGGEIEGGWKNVSEPTADEPLLIYESMPLADVISKVNKHSNNVMARQLLYTIAAETYGAPATEDNGRRAVIEWFAEQGLDYANLSLDNGAGLSRTSRMSARQMAELLKFAYRQPYMPEYLSSMSLTGLDGTMSRRFREDSLTGRAHIKTGSLDDVNAIAGYLQASSGARYAIVAMQNHREIHRGPGEEVQEALLRWLYEH